MKLGVEGLEGRIGGDGGILFGSKLSAREIGASEGCIAVVDCLPEGDEPIGVCMVKPAGERVNKLFG